MASVAEIEVEMKNFLLDLINEFCIFCLIKRSWKNLFILKLLFAGLKGTK